MVNKGIIPQYPCYTGNFYSAIYILLHSHLSSYMRLTTISRTLWVPGYLGLSYMNCLILFVVAEKYHCPGVKYFEKCVGVYLRMHVGTCVHLSCLSVLSCVSEFLQKYSGTGVVHPAWVLFCLDNTHKKMRQEWDIAHGNAYVQIPIFCVQIDLLSYV